MAYQLDYSQAGQIIVTGDRRFTVHLSSIATFNTSEITVSAVVVDSAVVLREIEGGVEHKFDIRDCSDPVYATPEDLMSDIEAQVAAMYAGGGGAVTSDDVSNESAVSGATVTDALNALASSSTPADLPYTYTNATSGDPTSGKIGFNTATPASINSVRISFTDGDGVSQSGLVAQLNTTGGTMLFRWSGGSLVLRIGDNSGSFGSWASYDATYVSGTLPTDGTAMSVDVALNAAQATESTRGMAAIASSAEVADSNSPNTQKIVTPRWMWNALTTVFTTLNSFALGVRNSALTGIDVVTTGAVTASSTVLQAIGLLQATKANKGANADITSMTGLTGDVYTPQHIRFALAPSGTPTEGYVYWDPSAQALAVKNNEADVEMTLGQETWIRVRNVSGATILNGRPVYISGSNSGLPTIALARANAEATALCRGVATHDIENNTNGYITIVGVVNAVDTSAFAAGDNLWVSPTTAGAFVNARPTHPNYVSRVGVVGVSNASTGTIVVFPTGTNMAQDPSGTTFAGTDTWAAGVAPSGASSKSQYFSQSGKRVSYQLSLTYATTGTTVTGITITLPTDFPTPVIPSGFTGGNAFIANCHAVRFLSTPTGTATLNTNCNLKRNNADTGFEIVATVTSGSYRSVVISGEYFTA